MSTIPQLPNDVELARTTALFDNETVPAGLRRAHRMADGVWGQLVVHSGVVIFVFEDEPNQPVLVSAGGRVAIPPSRLHHLEFEEPVTFVIEFHRPIQTSGAAKPDAVSPSYPSKASSDAPSDAPSEGSSAQELGGDPACWAHLFDDDAHPER